MRQGARLLLRANNPVVYRKYTAESLQKQGASLALKGNLPLYHKWGGGDSHCPPQYDPTPYCAGVLLGRAVLFIFGGISYSELIKKKPKMIFRWNRCAGARDVQISALFWPYFDPIPKGITYAYVLLWKVAL